MSIIEKEENNSYDLITRRETASNFTFYSQELSGRKNTFFLEFGLFINFS